MLLYPSGVNRFLREANTFKTASSQSDIKATMAQLQAAQPAQRVGAFTERQLVAFCNQAVRGGPAAPNTVKTRRTQVRAFFSWAAYAGLIPSDPSANLRFTVRPASNNVRQGLWLTEQQMASVLQACPDPECPAGRREQLILLSGFTIGLRLTEISTALRRSNISPDGTTLSFVGKGQKLAQLGLPQQLAHVIRETASPNDVLIPRIYPGGVNWTKPLGIAAIRKIVQKAGGRVGFDLDPHDMRRTFAGMLEQKGLNVQDICRLMRHKSIATTERYLEQNPARVTALGQGLSFDL